MQTNPEISHDKILEILKRDGVIVFDGLYRDDILEAEREHRLITSGGHPDIRPSIEMDGEKIFSLTQQRLRSHGLRHLANILAAPWFVKLANAYLQKQQSETYIFSLAVDGVKRDRDGEGNHNLHWDPTLSLRMMLYVGPTDRRNGALEVIRCTHRENHQRRLTEWASNIQYQERPHCAGNLQDIEAVEGSAGTVIVFDTSISHRRGLVEPDRERRVAFAHIHSELADVQMAGIPFEAAPQSLLWPHLEPLDVGY